jgi:hypothetical protein
MKKHDLRFYAKGSAFKDGVYDLRSMELLISSYRSITDRLIAVHLGRRQITPAIKNQIDYQVEVKSGSLECLIDFVFTHKEILGVLAADGGHQLSKVVTDLFYAAIDLRKIVASALKKGFPITITINNNMNIGSGTLISNNGKGNITIGDPKILWAAQVTRYHADRLIFGIDGKSIEFTEITSTSKNVRFTKDDKALLGHSKEELTANIKIIGRLDVVAFSSHKGTIISNQERFPVTWDEKIRTKVQRLADHEGIEFTVIDQKRLHSEAIAYHVLNCRNPQKKITLK